MYLKTFFSIKLNYKHLTLECAPIYYCIIIYPYPKLKMYVFLKETNIQSILNLSQYAPTF